MSESPWSSPEAEASRKRGPRPGILDSRKKIRPRRAWVAALLSLWPGVGHVYLGRPWQAILAMAWASLLFAAVHGVVGYTAVGWGSLALYLLLLTLAWFGPPAHAVWTAHSGGLLVQSTSLRRSAYVLVAVAGVLLSSARSSLVQRYLFETFYCPSGGMYPTLRVGDHVVVHWRSPDAVAVGDLIMYELAREGGDTGPGTPTYVKRVVGESGDTIALRGGRVIRNGRPVATGPVDHPERFDGDRAISVYEETQSGRGYLISHPRQLPWPSDEAEPVTVPEGAFYVLGDRRDASVDSRQHGVVYYEAVRGVVRHISYSIDPETWRVRWERIAQPIR